MTQTHYTQIEKHPLTQILAGAAILDHVPQFDGTNYVAQFPVGAYQTGGLLGRVSEINVTGAGATASVSGKRMTINVAGSSLTGTSGNGLTVGANSVSLAQATTISAGAMPAYPSLNPTFLFLRGDGLWAQPPSSGGGGGGTMSGWRSQLVNSFGFVQSTVNIADNFVEQFQAGSGINITQTDLGGGSRFTISLAAGAGYTHPSYTPQNFMPSLVGNVITIPAITTDGIGSVPSITGQSFTLPSGGGALTGNSGNGLTVTADTVTLALANTGSAGAMPALPNNANLFLNGTGTWTTPPTGGGGGGVLTGTSGNGLTVSANAVSLSLATVGSAGAMAALSGNVNQYYAGNGSWQTIPSGGGGNTVEVRYNDNTVNPAAFIINFKGAGVTSVVNGIGVEVTIPGATGGGLSGISINGVGSYPGLSFTGAGVSVSGSIVTISGAGGGLVGTSGNGLTVGTNSVSLAIATTSTAGAMPVLSGFNTQYLSGAGTWVGLPSSGLPSATTGQTMYYNGSAWVATSMIEHNPFPSTNVTVVNNRLQLLYNSGNVVIDPSDSNPTIGSAGFGDFSIYTSISTAGLKLQLASQKMGFFGATPVNKPSTTNDITSVRNALIALGLIS